MPEDILQSWVGRSQAIDDVIDARQARLMAATMDRDLDTSPGNPLPLLWHWIYFAEAVPMSEVGRDGHAALGAFLPPVDLPRRMWAGGRLTFHAPLAIGDRATRTSTVTSIVPKTGRSGRMCFVTVRHDFSVDGRPALTEEQDIVYLEPRDPDAPSPPQQASPGEAAFERTVVPNPVWLFRYSALTFNGHRIHYDLDFCRDVEGYPGLVVHGPLLATLLADLAAQRAGERKLARFSFRAVSPIFHDRPFSVHGNAEGDGGSAWALTPDGGLAMQADYAFA